MFFLRVFTLSFLVGICSCKEPSKAPLSGQMDGRQASDAKLLSGHEESRELSVEDYVAFLKQMKGITYNETETSGAFISLLYKPKELEAAVSLSKHPTQEAFDAAVRMKADYHYLLLSRREKKISAQELKDSKAERLETLFSDMLVLRNVSDTVVQCITELIPAHVMGQPDQLLVLVPRTTKDERLTICFRQRAGLSPAFKLDVQEAQLRQFPSLKI